MTHRLIAGVVVVGVLAASRLDSARQDSWPFTPDVEKFVQIYADVGGDKLQNWVRGETTSGPEDLRQAFEPIAGMSMELVASEPLIRQPISLHFDDRGRLWVVQYQQYPFPAGITINFYDQYLRARFDGLPAAPPNHVRGADKITVLEDTNGDGVFDSYKDVITGLNITTSVLTGRGGIWVMNPPYLLFYPDRNGDAFPDGNPEVRLEGFGLEDTHSLANSLTWGPDGWLYGAHGSTSTATVRGISFLGQAIWRYHPDTDAFEIFSEGGGNPWTLSFDSSGRAFSGDNGGNNRGFHWVQGGRYQKNWPKHGPFTRPHAYGYLSNMRHEGYTARFAMTHVVYEEGKLSGYEGQLISGMAMTNRIQATRFVVDGSTFRTVDTDALVTTSNRSFRPVDTKVGPDGAVYFADWCDIRMDHVDPRDTWDKSCGRIWRLQADDYQPVAFVPMADRSDEDLIELLGDTRKWYREQARRALGERRAHSRVAQLRRLAREERGQLALEALWTANLIGGLDRDWALDLLDHADASVRSWTVRLLGDEGRIAPAVHQRLVRLARGEPDVNVRSQLASTARRLEAANALPLLLELIRRREDISDKHVPLLIWWALEEKITTDGEAVFSWLADVDLWQAPLFVEHLAERIARRLAAERGDALSFTRVDPDENWIEYASHPRSRMPGGKGDYTGWETNDTPEISDRNLTRLARLLEMAPDATVRDKLLAGVEAGLEQGPVVRQVPEHLLSVIGRWWEERSSHTGPLLNVASRLGHPAVKSGLAPTEDPATGALESTRTASPVSAAADMDSFLTHCALCHQADGSGMERLAPPLRDSRWVLGADELLVRIVLNGLQGEMLMPPMGTLDDAELASILTYIRSAWGHQAGSVSAETVGRVRAETRRRNTPWTPAELLKLSREE